MFFHVALVFKGYKCSSWKRCVVLQIVVHPGWKYKRNIEISLKFLFSQEFGCNYESFSLNGEEVFKYVLLYGLSVQLSAVNSDFQAILQDKMKDMKERKKECDT